MADAAPEGFLDQFPLAPKPQAAGPAGLRAGAAQDPALITNGGSPMDALAGLSGDDFINGLQHIDPAGATVVKQVGEGRAPYPSGFIMKTPYGRWLVSAVGQAYPGMTAQDFQTKLATAKDFKSGKSAQMVKASNQAILHAQTALEASDKIGGSDLLPGVVNPIRNLALGQTSPDFQAARSEYDASINALAGELTKAFRGSTGALADVEHWRQNASASDSPTARRASIQAGMKLLGGSLDSLTDQYNRGMQANNETMDLLSPGNRDVFQRIMGGKYTPNTRTAGFSGHEGGAAAPAAPAAPPPGRYIYDPGTGQLKPAR